MGYPIPLVSSSWLANHLDDSNLVIADCRFSLMKPDLGRSQYTESHIPGSVYLHLNHDLSSPVQRHGGRHPLPDVNQFAQTLSLMGVTVGKTYVVAYDDSQFAFSARLWWLLRYFGHDQVAVLDGGFQTWQQAGYPVTQTVPVPQPGLFTPTVRSPMVVTIDDVRSRGSISGVAIVDSRSGERYRGEHEPIDPIAGHIPGAVNQFWKDVTDGDGLAHSPERQRSRWQSVADADEIMVYCGSGVTACVNLLSLELAGITTGKLYAGSWSDWCSYQIR
ncbi:MAG: sulfurtransferase [Cyanobacteria bacterium P01_E01_bin.6]